MFFIGNPVWKPYVHTVYHIATSNMRRLCSSFLFHYLSGTNISENVIRNSRRKCARLLEIESKNTRKLIKEVRRKKTLKAHVLQDTYVGNKHSSFLTRFLAPKLSNKVQWHLMTQCCLSKHLWKTKDGLKKFIFGFWNKGFISQRD